MRKHNKAYLIAPTMSLRFATYCNELHGKFYHAAVVMVEYDNFLFRRSYGYVGDYNENIDKHTSLYWNQQSACK